MVDASLSGYSNNSRHEPTGTSVTASSRGLSNNAYNYSRLGFRGTEDLGGGLAASFWLESQIKNDDGTEGIAAFSRRSTVSLSGGFGELRLGRDYTPTFWNHSTFDPFGTSGVGTNLVQTAASDFGHPVRSSNSIGFFLPPNLGGFYGQVQYAFHEKTKYDPGIYTPRDSKKYALDESTGGSKMVDVAAPDSRTGRYVGARFGYANGPLNVALALGNVITADDYFAGTSEQVSASNLGASYDFGAVKLFGELSRISKKTDFDSSLYNFTASSTSDKLNGWLVGVTVPVGAGLIRASYSGVKYKAVDNLLQNLPDPKANKLALGYVHNLSKRTALYATVARLNNKDGANLTVGGPSFYNPAGAFTPKSSTGYDFGIRHAF